MESQRQHKIAEQIAHLAADFISRESNRQALITVTRADISPDMARATIYFTVLPNEQEQAALAFLKRKRPEFRTIIKKKTQLRRIPFFDFEIDEGEKHRQHLDTIEI